MENFRQRKLNAFAMFTLSVIVALWAVLVYVKVYHLLRECKPDFLLAFKTSPIWIGLFAAISLLWMLISMGTLIMYRKMKLEFGPSAGAIVGSIIIVCEYLGYALLMVFLFI